jgi:hypothetical protein
MRHAASLNEPIREKMTPRRNAQEEIGDKPTADNHNANVTLTATIREDRGYIPLAGKTHQLSYTPPTHAKTASM